MADVLQVQPSARVKLQKNTNVTLYDQQFAPDPATYTKHVGSALSVPASGSVTLSLGGITAVRNFLFQSDTKCTVKLNGQSGLALVGTNMVMAVYSGSITQAVITNNHTTNAASIQYIATD